MLPLVGRPVSCAFCLKICLFVLTQEILVQYFALSLEINGNAHSYLEIISLRKLMKQQELESTTEGLNKVDFSLA